MQYRDKVLRCVSCGQEFVFAAGEQLFFADKGFRNEPRRCRNCKTKRTPPTRGEAFERGATPTVCCQCGKETTVPFKPAPGRPVYCRECFQSRRSMATAL
jgi:CxxC-x17-CxxC domain-containing protein